MRFFRILSGSQVLSLKPLAACALIGLFACTQGEGETCEVNRDCEDGLECTADGSDTPRGVCIRPGSAVPQPTAGTEAMLDAETPTPMVDEDSGAEAAGSGG